MTFHLFHPARYDSLHIIIRAIQRGDLPLVVDFQLGMQMIWKERLMCLEQHIQVAEGSKKEMEEILRYMTSIFFVVFEVTSGDPFGQWLNT